MTLIKSLSEQYRTLSVVGMAKNAGKTTTLNYLIEEAEDEGLTIGVTSTGRDGETRDVVTGTDKPRVYLYPDTLVSVPTGLFDSADAGLEILRMTKCHTSLGPAMICRVVDSGNVQVAGPVLTSDHRLMCDEMLALGADMILIDGAVDRRSIAAPETSDAIILATGAVLSRNIAKVAEETAHVAGLYDLPLLEDEAAAELFSGSGDVIVMGGGRAVRPDVKTGLTAGRVIDEAIGEDAEYVFMPGALTNGVACSINPKKFKHAAFVVKDPTKVFIDSAEWQVLRKKGFMLKTLRKIRIAAVSVNPVSPEGYAFEHERLMEVMEGALGGIKVIDVRI